MRKVFRADVSYWKQPLTFSPSLAVKKNPAVIQFHVADFRFYSTVSRTAQRVTAVSLSEVLIVDSSHVSSVGAVQSV